MSLFMQGSIAVVRGGFSYQRMSFVAETPDDMLSHIRVGLLILAEENPDEILISIKRPAPKDPTHD